MRQLIFHAHTFEKSVVYVCQTLNRPVIRPQCRTSILKGRAPFCEVGGKGLW